MSSKYKLCFKKYKIQCCSSLIILLCFNNVSAGKFYVLINADGGIPAVDITVQQGYQNPPPTNFLMDTLNTYPPESVNYLIIDRPTGNLLNLVNQNPSWSQAQLFRTIIIVYPFGTDATPILQAFENDSLVENVSYASAILNTIVFEPESLTSNTNVFVNIAMNSDCNEIGRPGLNVQGLSHNINQVDKVIELEAIMSVSPPGQPTICLNMSAELTRYDLGRLLDDDYTLKIYKVYGNSAFPIDPSQRVYLGERNFQVVTVNGNIQAVSIFNFFLVVLLMVVFLCAAYNKNKSLSRHVTL